MIVIIIYYCLSPPTTMLGYEGKEFLLHSLVYPKNV